MKFFIGQRVWLDGDEWEVFAIDELGISVKHEDGRLRYRIPVSRVQTLAEHAAQVIEREETRRIAEAEMEENRRLAVVANPVVVGTITLINPIQFEPETATTVADFEAELRRTDQYQITADIPHEAAWDRFSNDFFHHMNRYPSETEPGVRFRLSDAGGYSLRLYVRTDIKAKIPEVLTEDRQIPTTAWRELSNKADIIWDMLHRGFELRAKKPKRNMLDD